MVIENSNSGYYLSLDLGSGVGDVALIAARLVGPSGEVVGIERDPRSIARAGLRMAEAGLRNVSFTQSDAAEIPRDKPFDAAVGRTSCVSFPILSRFCDHCRSWFVPAESWPS